MVNYKYLTNFVLPVITVILLAGCSDEVSQKLEERSWVLTWSDEFNGSEGQLPDAAKWTYDIGTGNGGWGNQELQYYTNRPENVSLDGKGNLVITALRENYKGSPFTSARITTEGKFAQKHGRWEAKIKTPYGPGMWPAFWMLGENIKTTPWPQCGEIDIMEMRGQEPNIIHGSIHGPGYSGGSAITNNYTSLNSRFDTNFNIFAVEWDENKIDYFINDYLYARINKTDVPGQWVYDQPFFMIFNLAIGGNFVGFPTSQTPFPQKMIIDYVKVYKSAN